MQALAFVDLETTGATAAHDRITEIGIVSVDEAGVDQWSTLVNPGVPIPPFIQKLTGINDAMVREAPRFAELADEIAQRLAGRLFVAHNARFDYGFLKSEFRRVGRAFRASTVCTVRLSRKLYPQHHRHNLDALIERHALSAEHRHRALADARLIHAFWRKAQSEQGSERFAAVLAELTARPTLPAGLDEALIDELPESAGVYLLYGENSLPLYVGKAKNIHDRVLSHFSTATAKEQRLAQQVKRIDWIETAGELGALLLEAKQVKDLQPLYNRTLRRNEGICTWLIDGYGQPPRLQSASDADFARGAPCYGLFANATKAKAALRAIAEAHKLCPVLLGLETQPAGRPCTARQLRRCLGACIGEESVAHHGARLLAAIARQRLPRWPFAGAACLAEGDELLVFDRWRYLGSTRLPEELPQLAATPLPAFDADIFRLLQRHAGHLRPLPAPTHSMS